MPTKAQLSPELKREFEKMLSKECRLDVKLFDCTRIYTEHAIEAMQSAFQLGQQSQEKRIEELETALKEVIKGIESDYKKRCEDVDWYNNNMPGVGQELDYKSFPVKPIELKIAQTALNKKP
jgi:hypothetical protein